MRLAVLLTVSLILGVLATPVGAASPAQPDFADMDAFVQTTMHDRGIPGVALAVTHGDQLVHLRGFGVADNSGRPVTPQTPFRIGSNTKSMTALAIMQLVEQGKVDLDAPVQRYLPWFHLADADASSHITVQQLLNMTSGIPGSALYDSFIQPDLTLEQYGRDLAAIHTDRPVGSAFEYTNANYNLAGLIVEAVSGEPYAEYVEQHIFVPLGMTHTSASLDGERRHGLAQGYAWWFGLGPFPANDPFSAANLPAGYVTSTAEDLSHYLIAHLNGGRFGSNQILSPEGIARMHQAGPNTQTPAIPGGFGLGWEVGAVNGARTIDYTGETTRFVARQFGDLDNDWGLIVLTNAANELPSADEPYYTLTQGLIDRLEGVPVTPPGASIHVRYAVVDAALALVAALVVWSLLRLPRWYARLQDRTRSGAVTGLRRLATLLRITLEIAIPLAILVSGPSLVGLSWPLVLTFWPDLGWWTVTFASVLLATGVARGLLLMRARWSGRHSVTATASVPQPGLS